MSNYVFYQMKLTALSPLAIGSGENANTDHDVIRDGSGEPFIPASSLAGVLRDMLPKDDADKLFGALSANASRIIVGDAFSLDTLKTGVTVRDSVALDEYKVARKGMKFDREIVEAGGEYEAILELPNKIESHAKDGSNDNTDYAALLDSLLSRAIRDGISVGAKTTRGYGRLAVKVKKVEKSGGDWYKFDPYCEDSWKSAATIHAASETDSNITTYTMQLKLKDALSIRSYDIEAVHGEDETAPDFTATVNSSGRPVIPGTSWAGAFRHRYAQFIEGADGAKEKAVRALFGWVNPKKKDAVNQTEERSADTQNSDKQEDVIQRSRITFSETVFEEGSYHIKQITRTAISRFSGGASDSALYTENTCYGGTGKMKICVKDITEEEKKLLEYCILDLHNGFLSIGGLGSVGRGLFEVTGLSINGKAYKVGEEGFTDAKQS